MDIAIVLSLSFTLCVCVAILQIYINELIEMNGKTVTFI